MSGERKTHVWPWIVALLIGLPVLYVITFGPMCWLASRTGMPNLKVMSTVYWPVLRLAALDSSDGSGPVNDAIWGYANLGAWPDSIEIEVLFLKAYLAVPYRGPICEL